MKGEGEGEGNWFIVSTRGRAGSFFDIQPSGLGIGSEVEARVSLLGSGLV